MEKFSKVTSKGVHFYIAFNFTKNDLFFTGKFKNICQFSTSYFAEHLLLEHLFLRLSDMWKQAVANIAQGKNQKAKIARRFNIIFQN